MPLLLSISENKIKQYEEYIEIYNCLNSLQPNLCIVLSRQVKSSYKKLLYSPLTFTKRSLYSILLLLNSFKPCTDQDFNQQSNSNNVFVKVLRKLFDKIGKLQDLSNNLLQKHESLQSTKVIEDQVYLKQYIENVHELRIRLHTLCRRWIIQSILRLDYLYICLLNSIKVDSLAIVNQAANILKSYEIHQMLNIVKSLIYEEKSAGLMVQDNLLNDAVTSLRLQTVLRKIITEHPLSILNPKLMTEFATLICSGKLTPDIESIICLDNSNSVASSKQVNYTSKPWISEMIADSTMETHISSDSDEYYSDTEEEYRKSILLESNASKLQSNNKLDSLTNNSAIYLQDKNDTLNNPRSHQKSSMKSDNMRIRRNQKSAILRSIRKTKSSSVFPDFKDGSLNKSSVRLDLTRKLLKTLASDNIK
ncbi:uncharacterized protein CMU_018040 [Cryptosporidium muris RN66]|uniref:Uncharacterized protein n=1 Tax=Cryptosporidium muris (strain RN66) TaxID=441375 RepID=B6AD46_CRYMR|nr:uncharacterized protein CMU_018040 [Cryptosporidium muris RN66]EEA06050.1 hypothetical protein CMU_018040 [Cryptosporidium muris RN66]|eukprot:XP_002140399.1 hypothetical protein [Cryptosporidium muris RN66]